MNSLRSHRSPLIFAAAVLALGALAIVEPLSAHHSSAMFDHNREVVIKGVVKEFQWTNPHIWIQLDIESAEGVVEWSVEGGGPNSLSRQGWRPTTFKPGATVSLKINPMLDGTPAGGFVGAQFEDGSTLGRWE